MKKILSVIISLVLFVCCFNTITLAIYNESLVIDEYLEGTFNIDVKGESNVISGTVPEYYFLQDRSYSFDYRCYSTLDNVQRTIYDAVVNNVGTLSFSLTFDYGVFDYKNNWTSEYLSQIMNAICLDRPDIFYYAGYGVGGTLYDENYVHTLNYTVTIKDGTTYTEANIPELYNAIMEKLSTIPVDTSNRYNFMKSVNDYLCNNIYYPDLSSSDYVPSAHDIYGALIEGRAVCEGYSEAFKIICDYYNIPCICISGKSGTAGHMWNAMQMDDGVWYLTDTTWNDQVNRIYYDFFLVGTQSTNIYFNDNKFCDDHVNDSNLPLPLLNYSETAYNRTQNHNTGFGATYNSYADIDDNILYLSVFDAGKYNIYYNGIYVPVSDYSNGENFTVPSGANSLNEDWEMVILADINSDGVCDALDYSEAINLMFSSDDIINTAQERSCDVNLDGVIDVLDGAVIARASTGANTNIDLT